MTSTALLGSKAINAAIRSGNINIAGSMRVEVQELSADSREAQVLHADALRKLEARSRARAIVVPTAVDDVKIKLRELGHPTTLFGENHVDRRERLRDVIAALELSEEELTKIQAIINQSSTGPGAPSSSSAAAGTAESAKTGTQKGVFYSPAIEDLIAVRQQLSVFSFTRAQERLQRMRQLSENPDLELQERRDVGHLYNTCRELTLNSSEFGDDRPLSCVRYAPQGSLAATGSLTCNVKIWSVSDLRCMETLRGHEERVTAVAWHPDSANSNGLLASTSADATCRLWTCGGIGSSSGSCSASSSAMDVQNDSSSSSNGSRAVHTLRGHQGVVTSCEFHPNGRLLATSSADFTWRLWDIETQKELLLQDGHVKDCTAVTFHPDGSLAMSTDAAGVVLLWDLRSGQEIHIFQGHVQKISCAAFSSNGFQAATGSLDNMVRIWDLRQKKCSYCLPAHANLISDLRYSPSGETLLTSSFDGSLKLWGTRDHKMLRSLTGHLGKVMSCDISPVDERHVLSAGFDRTIKLFAHRDEF